MHHVNKTSALFQGPGLSERAIRPHWDQRKPQQLMQMCSGLDSLSSHAVCVHKHSDYDDSECSLHQGGPTELNHYVLTNSGHSDDLRGGRSVCLPNNQRGGGPVCLPDLFMVQIRLRKEQIDAELLTNPYYPNWRMMMGIICCATQLLQATSVTHFLIFHSGSHGHQTAMEAELSDLPK